MKKMMIFPTPFRPTESAHVENYQTNYILITSTPIADVVILSCFDAVLLYPAFGSHSPGPLALTPG
jgi:hypothetical protein